jgi:hypothetical protein
MPVTTSLMDGILLDMLCSNSWRLNLSGSQRMVADDNEKERTAFRRLRHNFAMQAYISS